MNGPVSEFPERIDVFPLPDLVPAGYRPAAVLFIDVLRATTTMTAALAAGAEQVIPVMEPVQAISMKRLLEESDPQKKGKIVLGGERKGVRIEGFDLGNSPSSYASETVRGKTLLFSTTNGTRAILTFERISALPPEDPKQEKRRYGGPSLRRGMADIPAEGRTRAFLGAFLNAAAVVERLRVFRSVALVCSGTADGEGGGRVASGRRAGTGAAAAGGADKAGPRYTEEDILLAGLLVSRLLRPRAGGTDRPGVGPFPRPLLNAQAETAKYLWESFLDTTTPERLEKDLYEKLLVSRGGENLRRIRLQADVRDASRLDRLDVVAEYSLGRVRLS